MNRSKLKNIKLTIKCERCKQDFDVFTKNPNLTKLSKKYCELCRVGRARERAVLKNAGLI